ncbi:MAG: HAD-IIIA family hydrolase [Desulfobacula sp.]|jgi:3-deoxy-D-manno-octulosonate 8-phosphate phosphatase (KDO 8-P phosphatase)|uniref:KdsC family phosphatase n=1 Tax=Desulfobacula sp. TaxID=2593537 RepID=UPI001DD4981A|nr:HAD-IIIA family hydrolase [Desulfobacula sp.]MBT3485871.1 HAD-IIIA family hydrolase [Desulfobacula sp.]MBT3805474.1 HAD-IIIA family hydrolase [Desulfobacula sp.]MBT4026811.1 HAD-IIIA family hydrolase [Desulfobacula sp.]MBT4199585.1 HAD-IIIA family hydrolase [Desulfobacula sp.]
MKTKLAHIKLLLLDVDGVLTDGGITYSDSGEQIKTFNSKDGFGIRLLMDSGIQVGIITGRKSKALEYRCKNLGITLLFDGIKDKSKALDKIRSQTKIMPDQIAFVGDDLMDIPVMKMVGVSFCVSDACQEVKNHSEIITKQKGGHGAVREICESILKSQGLWETILNKYLS